MRARNVARNLSRYTDPSAPSFVGVRAVPCADPSRAPRWRATIRDARLRGGRAISLGTYSHPRGAAHLYDIALMALGFDPVNFDRAAYFDYAPPQHLEAAWDDVLWCLAGPSGRLPAFVRTSAYLPITETLQ